MKANHTISTLSKVLLAILIASATGGLVACGQHAPAVQPLSLPMGYVANVQFSPFYVARERGYFSAAGFDVSFDYRWETDGVQLVAAGELPFTVASGDQVIQARSMGLPVVAIAAWWQQFPVGIVALEGIPLERPEDLRGLRIGIPETFGASYIGLRALLKAGGLTEQDIDLQAIGYTQLAALTAHTVDAVVVYANNEPIVLEQQGVAYTLLRVSDHSNLVSNVLVSNETYIDEHPKETAAFVDAFLQGLSDVLDDPEAALQISEAYVEGLADNRATQQPVLQASLEMWSAPKLGVMSADAWEQAQDVMLDAGLIENPVPVDNLFTNAFIADID